MTKRKLHQLTGSIRYVWLGTSKNRVWKNFPFYVLEIERQSLFGKSKQTIYAFSNLVSPPIWNTLEQRTFEGKTYHFFCEKRTRGWRLKSWAEVK